MLFLHARAALRRHGPWAVLHSMLLWAVLAPPALASEVHVEQVRRLVAEGRSDSALEVLQEALGEEHPDVAALLIERGRLLAEEEPDAALALCQRALALQEKALGSQHRDVGHALECLAHILPQLGEPERADGYRRRARSLLQSAEALGDLEQLQRARSLLFEQPEEALALTRPLLERQERALGAEHPLVLQTLGLMAWAHLRAGRVAEVEPLLKRVLGVHQRRYWPGSGDSLAAMLVLAGEVQLARDQLEGARESFDRFVFQLSQRRPAEGLQWFEFLLPFPDPEGLRSRIRQLATRLVARRQPLLFANQSRRALELRFTELEIGSRSNRHLGMVSDEEEMAEAEALMQFLTGRSRGEQDESAFEESKLQLLMELGRRYSPRDWRKLWESQCRLGNVGAKYALIDLRVRQLSFHEAHGRFGSLKEIGFEPAPVPGRLYTFTLEAVDARHFQAVARGRERMEGDVWRIDERSAPEHVSDLCASVQDPFALEPAPRNEQERVELRVRRELERVTEHLAEARFGQAHEAARTLLQVLDEAQVTGGWVLARVLSLLGDLEVQRGDYATAESLYQRLLTLQRQEGGEGESQVSAARLALAGVLLARGDTERAEPLLVQTMRDSEAHPERRRFRMGAFENLAQLHLARKEWARAEPLLRQSLRLLESTPHHALERGALLGELGLVYLRLGSPALAESFLVQARDTYSKLEVKDESLLTLNILELLGEVHLGRGEWATAERLQERVAHVRRSVLGVDHPDHARSLNRLSAVLQARGDGALALVLRWRALDIEELNIQNQLGVGSEEQKRLFLATLEDSTRDNVALHVHGLPKLEAAAHLGLTTLLQRKGRVLDVTSQTLRSHRERLSGETQRRFELLLELRARLATQVVSAPRTLDPEQYKLQLAELKQKVSALETELGTLAPDLRTFAAPVTVEAVQHALPPGSALVEFYRLEEGARSSYVAYVLHREGAPLWVELPEAGRIDQAAEAFRIAVATDAEEVLDKGRALDEVLMKPLRPLLGGATDLILSPDGVLNLVPFAALVDEQGRYLIETRTVSYVTSGRDLLPGRVMPPAAGPPLVLGDVDYLEAEGGTMVAAAEPQRRSVDLSNLRVRKADASDREEVRNVATVLGVPQERVLTRERATEGALRSVHSPRILHIVTHGFFLPSSDTIENPLLRSGLALAGFNRRQGGGSDDGVLTALEVSGLDLRATELVVLAACETGIGDVRQGEGVYGLRRALVLAGARTQVISLWKVHPTATSRLMGSWYEGLRAGRGRADAMTDIQRRLLEGKLDPPSAFSGSSHQDVRLRGWRHPYYWAGFIVSGEAGPLEMGSGRTSLLQARERSLTALKHEVAALFQAAGRESRSAYASAVFDQVEEFLALSQRVALRGDADGYLRETVRLRDELVVPPFAPAPGTRHEWLRALASGLEGAWLPQYSMTRDGPSTWSKEREEHGSTLPLAAQALLQEFEALVEPSIRGNTWTLDELLTAVARLPGQGSREQWRTSLRERVELRALEQLRRLPTVSGTPREAPVEEELEFLALRLEGLQRVREPSIDEQFLSENEQQKKQTEAVTQLERSVARRHAPELLGWLRRKACQALQRKLRSELRQFDLPEDDAARQRERQLMSSLFGPSGFEEREPLDRVRYMDEELQAHYRFSLERRGDKVSVRAEGIGDMRGDVWTVGPQDAIYRLQSACERH